MNMGIKKLSLALLVCAAGSAQAGFTNPANLDYALEFVKVCSSTTLPIPSDAPETTATVETLDKGGKALVVPFNPAAPSMFYRIEVGDYLRSPGGGVSET